MKPIKLVCSILLLWLNQTGVSIAQQIRIVKDNIACTYGLKDSSGNWIVQPVYSLIDPLDQKYFKVTSGDGSGVVDSNGRKLIDPLFDNVSMLGKDKFILSKGEKRGVADNAGKLVLPISYHSITPQFNGNYIVRRLVSDDGYYSTYVDSAFKAIYPEVKGFLGSYMQSFSPGLTDEARTGKLIAFIGDIPDEYYGKGNAGVIDENGKLVVSRDFELIRLCGEYMVAMKNGRIGRVDLNNRIVSPFQYQIAGAGTYVPFGQSYLPCLNSSGILQVTDSGRFGFINDKWQLVLPVEYEKIQALNIYQQSDSAAFIVYRNGKAGLAAYNGRLTLAPCYDTLIPVPFRSEEFNYQKPERMYFIYKKDGKYGLIHDNGDIAVAPNYENYFPAYYFDKRSLYFSSGRRLFIYEEGIDHKLSEASLIANEDSLYLFRINGTLRPFFSSESQRGKITSMGSEFTSYRQAGNFLYIQLPEKILLFSFDGKLWGNRSLKSVAFDYGPLAIVQVHSGNYGVLNLNNGRLILDTIHDEISCQQQSGNIVWALRTHKTSGGPVRAWMTYDTLGNVKSRELFRNVFYVSDTTVAKSIHGTGVLDAHMNWIIPPVYEEVVQIDDHLFAVYTVTGRFGLTGTSKQMVADTVYDNFIPVYSNRPFDPEGNSEALMKIERWWLLWSDSKRLLVNRDFVTISDDFRINEQLDRFALRTDSNAAYPAFRVEMEKKKLDVFNSSVYRISLMADLRRRFFENLPCNQIFMKRQDLASKSNICQWMNKNRRYILRHIAPLCFSVELMRYERQSSMEEPVPDKCIREFVNGIVRNGEVVPVSILDVFGSKTVLQDELIHSIQQNDSLNLDCADPSTMVSRIEDRFSFSKNGVVLYYSPNSFGDPIELVVTRERLSKLPSGQRLLLYLDHDGN